MAESSKKRMNFLIQPMAQCRMLPELPETKQGCQPEASAGRRKERDFSF